MRVVASGKVVAKNHSRHAPPSVRKQIRKPGQRIEHLFALYEKLTGALIAPAKTGRRKS
jgi:hypothetical protein